MERRKFFKTLGIGLASLSVIGCKSKKKIEKPEDFRLSKIYNLIEIKRMVPKNGHINYYSNTYGLKIINIADYKYDILYVFKKINIGEWIAIYYNSNNKYKKC